MEVVSLAVHIAAGVLAVLAGYVAIFAAKGAGLHRRSGMLFVWAMLVLGVSASVVAIARDLPGSRLGGPLAAYFAITALTAVRPIDRRLDIAILVVPLIVSLGSIAPVANALAQGKWTLNGVPIGMIVFLASVSLLAVISDVRLLRGRVLTGSRRIARHLWRMCFAFWIATGSFFLGQMDEFPVWLQNAALMSIPALLPLVLMLYWLWRVRLRGALAGLVLRRA